MSVKGKIALITGAASGIGLECVKSLLKNGAKYVAVCDLDVLKGEQAVKELQKEYGAERTIFIKTDVANVVDVEEAFKKTHTTFKALDIVINNAGICQEKRWELEVAVNLSAAVRGTLLGLQYMGKDEGGKGGVLINVSSIAGLAPSECYPIYSATKHGVIGLTRSFGLPFHFQRTGVRVMAMCPGATDTPIIADLRSRPMREEWGELAEKEIGAFPKQKPECVAEGLIHMIEKGSSGSVWLSEGGQPVTEIIYPDRQIMKAE